MITDEEIRAYATKEYRHSELEEESAFLHGARWANKVNSEEIQKLRNLLQALFDLQNGPPLERHRQKWEATMQDVRTILSKNA